MKKFIQARRNQIKNVRSSQENESAVKEAIAGNQPTTLLAMLKSEKSDISFSILLSEDELRRSTMTLMAMQPKWLEFF